jgi:hypothetical protein
VVQGLLAVVMIFGIGELAASRLLGGAMRSQLSV